MVKVDDDLELETAPQHRLLVIDAAGKVTNCDRCGAPCRVAERRNPHSKPFRLSDKPKGVCSNCVVTQFLCNTYPINLQLDEAGPDLLLKPGIREAFLASGLLDGCDLNIDEVNWPQVVANWRLPVAIVKGPKNPYRMGDSPKSYLKDRVTEPKLDETTTRIQALIKESDGCLRGTAAKEFMEMSGLRALLDQAKGPIQ